MRDKLWRAVYDRYHTPQADPVQRRKNVEKYHALVKMLATMERGQLLQIVEDKNLLQNDTNSDSFIDGLEMALMISTVIKSDINDFLSTGEVPHGIRKISLEEEKEK